MASASRALVWLITGCSSGFGQSLSLIALKAGHRVIATSRNPTKTPDLVKQVENLGGFWLALDINASPEDLRKVIHEGHKLFGRIDVLVNNAGIGLVGALEDVSPEEAHKVFDTNFFGVLNLIQALLPSMRSQRSGVIVNVSSAAALGPRPATGLYAASKWALEGLSEGLAQEVAPFGIRVLIVQPGAFSTNMMNAVNTTAKPLTEDYMTTEVGKWWDMFSREVTTFAAPNDVDKGCQGIFEVVTGTGRGKEKEGFLRLPLSADAAERTLLHMERLKTGYDTFKDIWESTSHDDGEMKSFIPKK